MVPFWSKKYGIDSWRVFAGDVNSTVVQDKFMHPKRRFETNLSYVGLSTSIDEFAGTTASQIRVNWNKIYTAESILTYF